jgi:hypothetical protein
MILQRPSWPCTLDPTYQNRYVFCLPSNSRHDNRFHPLAWLAVVASLELVINRVLRPWLIQKHPMSSWTTTVDYASLFLLYFATTLAIVVAAQLAWQSWRTTGATAKNLPARLLPALLVVCVAAVVTPAGTTLSLALDVTLALVVIGAVFSTFGGAPRDLGARVGLLVVCAPILLHCAVTIYARAISIDAVAESTETLQHATLITMCVAAMLSPYCFAPRPFAAAVIRIAPVAVAMTLATAGALALRFDYVLTALSVDRALGIEISSMHADPKLALYLLSLATLLWTIASALVAQAPDRRRIGLGLFLLLLAGASYRWPVNYALVGIALTFIAQGARQVRSQEQPAPQVDDAVWSTYVASVARALRVHAPQLHVLSTRDTDAEVSTLLVGEIDNVALRVRMSRRQGCLQIVDVLLGREPLVNDSPTLVMLGHSPVAAAAVIVKGERHRIASDDMDIVGPVAMFTTLRGEGSLPGAALCEIPGWIGYWPQRGLLWRALPGRDASYDFPIPLHDLAMAGNGKAAAQNADRFASVVATLIALATRADVAKSEPALGDVDVSEGSS